MKSSIFDDPSTSNNVPHIQTIEASGESMNASGSVHSNPAGADGAASATNNIPGWSFIGQTTATDPSLNIQ
jgi:hypothetical protein